MLKENRFIQGVFKWPGGKVKNYAFPLMTLSSVSPLCPFDYLLWKAINLNVTSGLLILCLNKHQITPLTTEKFQNFFSLSVNVQP